MLIIASCSTSPKIDKEGAVARVYNNYLYQSDLKGIGKGLSKADSAQQAKTYIDKWIIDQLILGVALKNFPNSKKEKIDRLVESYRASLIVTHYEQELINEKLDTIVDAMQLADYYNTNQEQYSAGFSWVRCLFIRLPRDIEGLDDVRRWFRSGKDSDIQKLKQFCLHKDQQVVFAIQKERWLKLDYMVRRLPDKKLSRKYLQPDRVYDRSTDKYVFLYKTLEYRDKTNPAPLVEVQDEISRIILHQRRQEILNKLRKNAFEKAKEGGVFERYY